MTPVFWFVAALLICGALLFVLPPLLQPQSHADEGEGASPLMAYREQRAQLDAELAQATVSAHAHARGIAELQARVVEEVGELSDAGVRSVSAGGRAAFTGVLCVALLLPGGALGLYALLGQPAALKPHGIEGTVVLQDSLKSTVPAGATLFVFARAAQGPRAPLAILRIPAGDFPQRFRLDDSLAMSPDMVLSSHALVTLGARISPSGDATPRTGDLVGTLGPVRYGASGVRLVIDGAIP
jgi:cytochrome c-type biogenesis protein CcmI